MRGGEFHEVSGAANDGVGEQQRPACPRLVRMGDDVHIEVADAAAERGLDAELQCGRRGSLSLPGGVLEDLGREGDVARSRSAWCGRGGLRGSPPRGRSAGRTRPGGPGDCSRRCRSRGDRTAAHSEEPWCRAVLAGDADRLRHLVRYARGSVGSGWCRGRGSSPNPLPTTLQRWTVLVLVERGGEGGLEPDPVAVVVGVADLRVRLRLIGRVDRS